MVLAIGPNLAQCSGRELFSILKGYGACWKLLDDAEEKDCCVDCALVTKSLLLHKGCILYHAIWSLYLAVESPLSRGGPGRRGCWGGVYQPHRTKNGKSSLNSSCPTQLVKLAFKEAERNPAPGYLLLHEELFFHNCNDCIGPSSKQDQEQSDILSPVCGQAANRVHLFLLDGSGPSQEHAAGIPSSCMEKLGSSTWLHSIHFSPMAIQFPVPLIRS